jgi:2-keto-4-pentenoate hydratase/2-oxohepta-3-ene-1,7-dioic acid hydratase in catechol pathway
MKIAAYKINEQMRIGIVPTNFERKIFDVSHLTNGNSDIIALIKNDNILSKIEELNQQISRYETLQDELVDLQNIVFLPPIERPGKIVCLAGNYRAHITESGYIAPKEQANFTQQLFLKPSTSLTGDGAVIEFNQQNARVGWETELAVIIGKKGKNIQPENAFDYIFGYTILNDLSERGLNSRIENRTQREMDGFCDWLAGKWFDGFAPCGPWIVTKDEIADPHNLEIKFYLNGELRQHGKTSGMIFSIPEQISYISSIMTLEPGDIISTGTPAGAGLGDKKTSLSDGDALVSEIEGIGQIKNSVRWAD